LITEILVKIICDIHEIVVLILLFVFYIIRAFLLGLELDFAKF